MLARAGVPMTRTPNGGYIFTFARREDLTGPDPAPARAEAAAPDPDQVTVFCLTCGAPMIRRPDPEGINAGYPAFQWFDLAGGRADHCPQCGEVTSALTTAPAPDLATVGAMARALHFLCAAVNCNYDPLTIKHEGYLEAGRAALRAAGWDPDRPRPGPDRPQRAPVVMLDGACYGPDDLTPTGLTGQELGARIADHLAAALGIDDPAGDDPAPAMLALLRRMLELYDGQRLAPPETFAAYWQEVRAVIGQAEGASGE
jgi:hypothetical protein